jgi:hypothetical protein
LYEEFSGFYVLDSKSFCDFLEAREIMVTERDLETFEREGLLLPIFRLSRRKNQGGGFQGFSTFPSALRSYLDDGLIEFPTSGNFRAWSSFGDGYDRSVYVFYHPVQTLLIRRLLEVTHVRITGLHGDVNWGEFGSRLTETYGLRRSAYVSSIPEAEKRISLILRLEAPYAPLRLQRFKVGGSWHEAPQKWRDWRDSRFSPTSLLTASGLTIDQIESWRDGLALEAIHFDPIGDWYMLVRLVNSQKKHGLRGKALLAQDYYEYVSLLNLFLEELTGKRQPEPHEIADSSDGSWKRILYGDDFDLDKVETQKKVVGEYFQYGERVLTKMILVVEGDSEEACVPSLCHELQWAFEADAQLTNLSGSGNLNGLKSLLESAREDNVKVHLVIDRHGGVTDTVEDLVRAGLLENNGYKIWQKDFEDDNFSEREIITAVNELLQKWNYSVSIEELNSAGDSSKPVLKRVAQVVYTKYRENLKDILSKRDLAMRLVGPRLKEIHEEINGNCYTPKLELEKALIQASKRISITHMRGFYF